MAGGTGLVGKALGQALTQKNHVVILVTRNPKTSRHKAPYPHIPIGWNDLKKLQKIKELNDISAVINLSGTGIADKRWTKKYKKQILLSRVESTKTLSKFCRSLKNNIKVFISTSAVGFYGWSETKLFTEQDPAGHGFLSRVCHEWEQNAKTPDTCRKVILRLGMVLSDTGGALTKMLALFRLGLGGVLGKGTQIISWIDIEDLVRIYLHALEKPLQGIYNAVAPQPVTNKIFTKLLAQRLKRPAFLPVPGFLLQCLLGETADILLKGQKVSSEKITKTGFCFNYPELSKSFMRRVL